MARRGRKGKGGVERRRGQKEGEEEGKQEKGKRRGGKKEFCAVVNFFLGETLVLARQLVVRAAYSYTHSDVATVDKINAICRRTAAMRAFAVSTLTSAQMMMIG